MDSDDDELAPGAEENEVTLPRNTVVRTLKDMLPPEIKMSKEAQDLVQQCCQEYIHLLGSEANEICEGEQRNMVQPDDVLRAIQELGFKEQVEGMTMYCELMKAERDSSKAKAKIERKRQKEMSAEEAIAEQKRLFEQARSNMG
mmetsp:Transcript_2615/g.9491  ORF Transcript_2615/g.9491 Transcript_2615/m.9491 type:complete len:144 (-) Transcript_2615:1385-1816(-)